MDTGVGLDVGDRRRLVLRIIEGVEGIIRKNRIKIGRNRLRIVVI